MTLKEGIFEWWEHIERLGGGSRVPLGSMSMLGCWEGAFRWREELEGAFQWLEYSGWLGRQGRVFRFAGIWCNAGRMIHWLAEGLHVWVVAGTWNIVPEG